MYIELELQLQGITEFPMQTWQVYYNMVNGIQLCIFIFS